MVDLSLFADKTWLIIAGVILVLVGTQVEWVFNMLGRFSKLAFIVGGILFIAKGMGYI